MPTQMSVNPLIDYTHSFICLKSSYNCLAYISKPRHLFAYNKTHSTFIAIKYVYFFLITKYFSKFIRNLSAFIYIIYIINQLVIFIMYCSFYPRIYIFFLQSYINYCYIWIIYILIYFS